MYYRIYAQFVNRKVKYDDEAKRAIDKGIEFFNSKSLMAKNSKKIINYGFSKDDTTMIVTLASDNELPNPSKALRILSTYLINNTCLKGYSSGKQLFKMRMENTHEDETVTTGNVQDATQLERVSRYLELLKIQDASINEDLVMLDEYIEQLLEKYK